MNFLSNFDFKTFFVAGLVFAIGSTAIDYYLGAGYDFRRIIFLSIFFGLYMSLSRSMRRKKNQ